MVAKRLSRVDEEKLECVTAKYRVRFVEMNSMLEKTPKVSVLMTAYNREQYIAEAIESVLASTYTNFELIIVDDCSSDNTVAITREFEKKDNRIRVYVNDVNLGDYPNRNKAASYAIGSYIKYLDSDDCLYPWSLAVMVFCMTQYPEAAVGYSTTLGASPRLPRLVTPMEAYRLYFMENKLLSIGPSGTIINKSVFEKFEGFRGTHFTGDTDLWMRISQFYDVVLMPGDLVYWRQHELQEIFRERSDFKSEATRMKMHIAYLKAPHCPLPKSTSRQFIRNLKNIKARKIFWRSIVTLRIPRAIRQSKSLQLNVFDYLIAAFPNRYPKQK